jgi:hypothetical protein
MEPHEELADIYTQQAERARRSASFVAVGGGLATLTAAIMASMAVPEGAILPLVGVGGAGAALTAALFAAVSALRTHAEARAARHAAQVPEDEAVTP